MWKYAIKEEVFKDKNKLVFTKKVIKKFSKPIDGEINEF